MHTDKQLKDKNWAVAMHLSLFAGIITPIASIVTPLVLWALKKKESEYLNVQGKEVINFLICQTLITLILVAAIVAAPLMLGPEIFDEQNFQTYPLVALVLGLPLGVFGVMMPLVGAIKCASGENFKYPFIFRVLR